MTKLIALHLIIFFIVSKCSHLCSSHATLVAPTTVNLATRYQEDDKITAHDNLKNSNNNETNQQTINSEKQKFSHQYRHQTSKSPRTIQRLIGGHIKLSRNIEPDIGDKIATSTVLSPIPNMTIKRIERNPNRTRSIYRTINRKRKTTTTTPDPNELYNYDEAFLDDPNDFDNGIQRSSAGDGREEKSQSKKKLDPNKTLSDQVKDGKYGLIEKELFQDEPQRPGIISYLENKEVPNDNAKSLGGLQEEDIWLAEDHLLVLKGGGLNEKDRNEPWKPIDDFIEEDRPIKLPENPKIPPPFPVQLEENGPIQFIGDNQFPFFDPFVNQSLPVYTTSNENNPPSETISDYEKNLFARKGPIKNITVNKKGGYFYPKAQPNFPLGNENQEFVNPFLNPNLPVELGGLGGAVSSMPNVSLENTKDYFDEDDPSLYYPPKYSFHYKTKAPNTVEAGPLVPGIVLPPPPSAFSRFEKAPTKKPYNEIPFEAVLTKISEYEPKAIIVTPSVVPTKIFKQRPTTTTTTTTEEPEIDIKKEIVYAVTEPPPTSGKVRYYTAPNRSTPTPKPEEEFISFVPQTQSEPETLSHPIYYEYFDVRKNSKTTTTPTSNPYYDKYFTSTTPSRTNTPSSFYQQYVSPVLPTATTPLLPSNNVNSPNHSKTYTTTTKPVLKKPYNSYLPVQNDVVRITPKSEIRSNSVNNFVPIILKPKASHNKNKNFEHEVNAIRETLQYYKQTNVQRAPKGKPVYEYSFDATKSHQPKKIAPQFDPEPFKPMVKYSPPIDDVNGANGFKAINTKIDSTTTKLAPLNKQKLSDRIRVQIIYDPIQSQQNYYSQPTPNTISTTHKPWVSIEKQVLQEVDPQQSTKRPQSRKIERVNPFSEYSYVSPPPQRHNTRFYEEPFLRHINSIRSKLNQYQQQRVTSPPFQRQEYYNLENDTLINYIPHKRPQINPDAEFIPGIIKNSNSYEQIPSPLHQAPYQQQHNYQNWNLKDDTLVNYLPPLPPINPDAENLPQSQRYQQPYQQYNNNNHNSNNNNNNNQNGYYSRPYNGFSGQNQQQRQQLGLVVPGHSLTRDTLVNYRKPLPSFNPNAEFIDPQRPILNHYRIQPHQTYGPPPPPPPSPSLHYDQNLYSNNNYQVRHRPPK